MIRQIAQIPKLADAVALGAIEEAVPQEQVRAVVAEQGVAERRRRRLPAELTILLIIAMNLFSHYPLEYVLFTLGRGLRLRWLLRGLVSATKSAISQARYRLGPRPMAELFRRVCQPMATQDTQGAFLFDLRVMAIDGTTEDVPDTFENDRAFGRPSNDRGDGAFPQVQAVYLVECGTHAVVDAGFWPYGTGERLGGMRLLRSVTSGMLLMWDQGFHSFAMAKAVRLRAAHFLGRVPNNVRLKPLRVLSDGSYLACLQPCDHPPYRHLRRNGEQLLVRVISYTLDDPALVGFGQTHRLMTSLLSVSSYPALDLVCAYHERWESELVIDEMDTHQRLPRTPLRSRKPLGVIQELYGLLIAHYVIRHTMLQSALQAQLDPDRLSFTRALRLICDAFIDFQLVDPSHHHWLYRQLLQDIARNHLPPRANRINPRAVKRQQSPFPRKRPTHSLCLQPSKPFRDAVVMLN